MWYAHHYFGMHMFWWLFWVVLMGVFFVVAISVPRRRAADRHREPLDILMRRYASGQLTTEQYEERKQRLEADLDIKERVERRPGQPAPQS